MHTHEQALKLEQEAYHGGRCECYRLGENIGEGWLVDVRSMYGAIMCQEPLPVRLLRVLPESECWLDPTEQATLPVIARVELETAVPWYPLARDGDVIYPVGEFTTTLCGPELLAAVVTGAVRRVLSMAEYELDTTLQDWARRLCSLRDSIHHEWPPSVDAALKRLLCCLPGKFAQRLRRWQREPKLDGICQYGEVWGGGKGLDPFRTRYIGGAAYVDVDMGLHPDANLAIAAWITSRGRAWLSQLVHIAGHEHVWYVDTDALIVDKDGLNNLLIGRMLDEHRCGQLSVRHGPGMVSIYGLKHYSIGDHHVCAGLPRGVLTDCGDGLHHWYAAAAAEQVVAGNKPAAQERLLVWPPRATYRHGVVGKDGWVRPIRLSQYGEL